MRRPLFLLLLLYLSSPLAETAFPPLGELDYDGDKHVSLAEAAGNEEIVTRFDRADRNRDGRLSAREWDALKNVAPRTRYAAAKGPAKPPRAGSAAAGGSAPRKQPPRARRPAP